MNDFTKDLTKLFRGLSLRFAKIAAIYRAIPAPVKKFFGGTGLAIAVEVLFRFLDTTKKEIAEGVKRIESELKDVHGRLIGARQDVANLGAQQMAIAASGVHKVLEFVGQFLVAALLGGDEGNVAAAAGK